MQYDHRLKLLRQELLRRSLSGFVVPLTDEHLSEYVGDYAKRLAWLTGFRGSAGIAVVFDSKAAIFVDRRYALQVREQVDGKLWSYESLPSPGVTAWLQENTPLGARIGYDPWLHTPRWVEMTRAALQQRGGELVPVDGNPIDSVWLDRPIHSVKKLIVHPDAVAGKTSVEKRRDIAAWLGAEKLDAVVISALDSIAWTFNIRGSDIPRTPFALAFAVVNADGSADFFIAPEKVTSEVSEHFGHTVRLHSRDRFAAHLTGLEHKRVAVDPERTVAAIQTVLEQAGATIIVARDPALLPKAIKNQIEIAGHKAAQARDGAALCRFLHWLSVEAPDGELSELSAAARLEEFRKQTGVLKDLSFDTISAFGPNGAKPHYRPSSETNRRIESGSLYVVDSGGQYTDGTTDVTRTIAIGRPTAEMRDRFTRVLKGHIALAMIVFPKGTRGGQLDILARQYLWAIGLDYEHGTGHGVGFYLSVHEGPQRIFNSALHPDVKDEPLLPGMILSNEPGYYKSGEFGIRIENLILVVEKDKAGSQNQMLGFETLTFAPIDRTLIDVAMLSPQESAWINAYHVEVAAIIGPQLQGKARDWLMENTRALD